MGPCPPAACRLPEAQVTRDRPQRLRGANTTTASNPADRLGAYEIAGLQAGTYTITFSKAGYSPQTFSVTLVDDEPERVLDVTLEGVQVALSGTSPNCTGVEVVLRDGRPLDPPAVAAVRPDGTYRIAEVGSRASTRSCSASAPASLSAAIFTLDAGEAGVEVDGFCVPPPTTTMGIIDVILGTTTTTATSDARPDDRMGADIVADRARRIVEFG